LSFFLAALRGGFAGGIAPAASFLNDFFAFIENFGLAFVFVFYSVFDRAETVLVLNFGASTEFFGTFFS
jgi:hypothetical protein